MRSVDTGGGGKGEARKDRPGNERERVTATGSTEFQFLVPGVYGGGCSHLSRPEQRAVPEERRPRSLPAASTARARLAGVHSLLRPRTPDALGGVGRGAISGKHKPGSPGIWVLFLSSLGDAIVPGLFTLSVPEFPDAGEMVLTSLQKRVSWP